ncbi:MAG: hypothetical protein JXA42_25160, partial [Anaerolineales bacterium]|nr:hypothetical protein [Anaerolineales bacterium]
DSIFFIVWGAMFGGIPLLIGLSFRGLFLAQVLVLFAAFLTTFFFWDRIREMLNKPGIMLTLFGGIFFVSGCAALGLLINIGENGMSALFGLVFCGLGGFLVYFGLKKLFGPPDSLDDE